MPAAPAGRGAQCRTAKRAGGGRYRPAERTETTSQPRMKTNQEPKHLTDEEDSVPEGKEKNKLKTKDRKTTEIRTEEEQNDSRPKTGQGQNENCFVTAKQIEREVQ